MITNMIANMISNMITSMITKVIAEMIWGIMVYRQGEFIIVNQWSQSVRPLCMSCIITPECSKVARRKKFPINIDDSLRSEQPIWIIVQRESLLCQLYSHSANIHQWVNTDICPYSGIQCYFSEYNIELLL